jgi:hypothetical protein
VRWDIVVVVDGKWKRQAKTRRNRKKREEWRSGRRRHIKNRSKKKNIRNVCVPVIETWHTEDCFQIRLFAALKIVTQRWREVVCPEWGLNLQSRKLWWQYENASVLFWPWLSRLARLD